MSYGSDVNGGSPEGVGGSGNAAGDGPGSGWAGKPGEDAIANALATGSGTNKALSSAERQALGWGDMQGFNTANPSQSVDEMRNSERAQSFLGVAVPMAMSAVTPGLGLISSVGRAGANLLNGKGVLESMSGLIDGYINGKVNQATGGLYGQASMAAKAANYFTGSPEMPNLGRAAVSALGGGATSSGRSMDTQVASSSPNVNDGGDIAAQARESTPTPQPAATAVAQNDNVNFSTLGGLDSAGWTNAARRYIGAKNGLV